ncbi:hypothetical protein B5P46_05360 [Rhizobium leguminosarum]|uniref:Swt1-like HEPN domain-containing protein n=1 Tax=Rhizobium leguminosarum TaxID=384 RepID=A0A4Q1U8Y6_RHILE|nr:Swt1 family HEPN domain-containing protein [Rhizobium leguminosarum]RXT28234.1 hypothetical protein B5P46_05360 [Rhizobium leguminosarum]
MSEHTIELFLLKCAVIESGLRDALEEHNPGARRRGGTFIDERMEPFIKQFELANRNNASKMSMYYEVFYMLENDIRRLIIDTMETAHGAGWWDTHVPQAVRDEVKKNRDREDQAAWTMRSNALIDYSTFGQLADIMRANWSDFAGMLRGVDSMNRVLHGLNMLRGTIAHCGVLADDEVDRLQMSIRDWFRVLEGPKA